MGKYLKMVRATPGVVVAWFIHHVLNGCCVPGTGPGPGTWVDNRAHLHRACSLEGR